MSWAKVLCSNLDITRSLAARTLDPRARRILDMAEVQLCKSVNWAANERSREAIPPLALGSNFRVQVSYLSPLFDSSIREGALTS